MRNAGPRRNARLLTIIAATALVFPSLRAMASAEDSAARLRSAEPRVDSQSIPLQLMPVSNVMPQIIVDGGFEAGIPNPNWTETSTNFGTPLCDVGSCGTGGGSAPPRTGLIWAWFGGIGAPESATLGQTVTIPSGVTAILTFWMRIGAVSSPFTDVLNVRVDGTIVQAFVEPSTAEGAYTLRTIDLTAFANGAAHTILFDYVGLTSGTANFVVDDVELNTTAAATVAPASLAVDTAGNGVLQPNEAAVVVAPSWRNTSTGTIASMTGALTNFTGPVGPTYSINDAAANYGSLAAGATATCGSNCYAVTATAAVRPATHWDASALETVSVGPTTKTWTLHVGDSFTDVPPSNPFYRFVETILHRGITGGCTATAYCPANSTTRAQMAVFVLVAKEGAGYMPPACSPPNLFTDVPETSPFCPFVEELARRGVVSGCGGGNYCPNNPVNREQMAVFVLRTLEPALTPPACSPPNLFTDVPETSAFCRWIEELARRAVVTGCGGGNYCPLSPVTRGQMGVFLAAGFSLTLYGL